MKLRFWVLSLIMALGLTVAVQAQSLQKLDLPDEVAGELQGEPLDFELTSAESIVIELSLSSDAFDPLLELLDAEGNSLAQNDDGGDGTGSLLSFLAEANTVYTVRARSYYEDASGSFTLVVSGKEVSEITFDQSAATEFKTKPQIFTFTGKAGDEVDFVVEAKDFDTILTLLDVYGNALTSSDDGNGLNPFISDFVLPADGTYLLSLSAYSDEAPAAPIQVSVRPTTIQDMVFGEAFTTDTQKSYLRFEAQAGTTYRIEVRAEVTANLSIEIKPQTSESYEASGNTYGASSLTIEVTPANDGLYKLNVTGATSYYEATPYTVTISEVK